MATHDVADDIAIDSHEGRGHSNGAVSFDRTFGNDAWSHRKNIDRRARGFQGARLQERRTEVRRRSSTRMASISLSATRRSRPYLVKRLACHFSSTVSRSAAVSRLLEAHARWKIAASWSSSRRRCDRVDCTNRLPTIGGAWRLEVLLIRNAVGLIFGLRSVGCKLGVVH
jgi:hypothetical protein